MKALFAVGGTNGHLLPAKKMAHTLLNKKVIKNVLFAASGLSNNRNFEKIYPYKDIKSAPFILRPYKLIYFFYSLLLGIIQSAFLIIKYKPDIVFGFGGYHSFSVLLTAKILKKNIYLIEPNTKMGKVNRFFNKDARKILLQFPIDNFNSDKTVFVKPFLWKDNLNFITKDQAKESLSLKKNVLTILVFGGSQGALFLNKIAFSTFLLLKKQIPDFQIIHLTGSEKEKENYQKKYEKAQIKAIVKSFLSDLEPCYFAADFVICRSGAGSISELIFHAKPSVLIPYPYAAEKHQEKNALFLQDTIQGAIKIDQNNLTTNVLLDKISCLLKDFSKMENNLRSYREKKNNNNNFYNEVDL